MKWHVVSRALGVVLVVVAGTTTVGIQPAAAVGCWGDYCSGTDPEATGCSRDAYTVANAFDSNLGYNVELRWSPTCKTNWARVNTKGPQWVKAVQSTGYTQWGTLTASGSPYSWSRQIYSPYKCVSASGSPGWGARTLTTACR